MMRIRTLILLLAITVVALGDDSAEIYLRDIKPMLRNKCYSCHGAIKQEGGLRLDTAALMKTGGLSGSAVVPDSPVSQSLLFERTASTDDDLRMPPDAQPLSARQLDLLARWIRSGANGPDEESPQINPSEHWAFRPVHRPDLSGLQSVDNPIDHFIDTRLSKTGIAAVGTADDRTLIRRMYLDLHGLPPTPEEMHDWIGQLNDEPSDRQQIVSRLIDSLLSSPRYGERWAQHWLDIVRYADTHGFEVNTPRPNAWHYRDYVIDALNRDLPYDQFVSEQLAGDAFDSDAATGFLVAAAVLLPGQIGKDEASKRIARQDALDEIIVGTSATFLGLTVGCARCHDHKFDPISQRDYYRMQAFFAGVEYGDREMRSAESLQRVAEANRLLPKIDQLRSHLGQYAASAQTGRTIVIDDEDLQHVTLLREKAGHGTNPAGTARGYRDDPGNASRMPNLSRGRYTWWTNAPGEDVFTWNPASQGRFQLWISWGAHGSGVHTHDARYVLDLDGDLSTRSDQSEIARADQYYHSGVRTGSTEQKPMWSGLQHAGIHEFQQHSRLVLRCGDSQRGITADVIVMQEVDDATEESSRRLPVLRDAVNAKRNIERLQPIEAKYVRWTSLATIDDNKHQPCIDEFEVFPVEDPSRNIGLATEGATASSSGNYSTTGKHQLPHVNDGIYGNDHSWISNEHGRGWVQLELPKPRWIGRIEWGRDREEKFKDRLGVRYTIDVSKDGKMWTRVASERDRMASHVPQNTTTTLIRNAISTGGSDLSTQVDQLERLETQRESLLKPQMVYAGRFRKPETTHVLHRGDPEQPADEVTPMPPAALTSDGYSPDSFATVDEQQRRIALSQWITCAENPLTARVIVNRIWQYHFGHGIVETSSDFGLSGSAPSHPQLLDWLASEMIRRGWSLKSIHRLILSSRTYQRSNRVRAGAAQVDSGSRLLWRFPARRLEGEAIRDSMLWVSGQLNLSMGGPGFALFKSRGGLSGFPPIEEYGATELRRMIFSHKVRMERVPVFGAFDCPDAGQPMPKRSESTTPIQALNLFNSQFVIDSADRFAARMNQMHPNDLSQQIDQAFWQTLSRSPRPHELTACLDVARTHGLSAVCRVLFNSNEFLYLP